MSELLRELVSYLRGMWHRRWIGLGVAWLAAVIGVAVVYKIPERYEASARVYVDTETLLKPLLAGLAVQPNLDQQVALMSRTLIGRPNVDKLVRMADLDLKTTSQSERDELIDDVLKTIKLTGNVQAGSVQANLYEITYRDPDPVQARRVVQSLLSIFVESSLGDKKQDTQTAVKFLDDQVKRYEEQLQASENRLKEFKLKYLGVADKEGPDYFARMAQIRKDIESARLEAQSAEEARDAYKKELLGESPTLLSDASEPRSANLQSPEIDARLETLRKALDELRRKYTDLHPDVAGTRKLIAQLEEERKEQIEARRKAAANTKEPSGPDRNPVFQQLRISLAESEARFASAKAKLAGYERQYNALKAQAVMVPQIEAEFTQLNRDYEVQKRTYESLVARRESATMGKDVQDTGGARFRVIDPPRVSPEPVAPRRIVMLGAALALAVLAGLAASFVASQVAPIFHETRSLRDVSKRPILGTISLLASERVYRLRRRNAWLFAGGLAGLFASFGAVFAFALLIGRVA
jgi:polysaccharide chain length determinant protein (PEP-CTERM system associated)